MKNEDLNKIMQKLYVIKFNNEYYWCGNSKFSKELRHAQIYVDPKRANNQIYWILSQDRWLDFLSQKTFKITYKLVEVELKEVE